MALVGSTAGKSGQIVDSLTGTKITPLTFADSVDSIDFSSGEKYLLAYSGKKQVGIWSVTEARKLGFSMDAEGSWDIQFSPDDRYAAINKSALLIFDMQTGQSTELREGRVRDLAFSDDSRYVAAHGKDETLVQVWEADRWHSIAVFQLDGFLSNLRFVPEKAHLETTVQSRATTWVLSSDELIAGACRGLNRNLNPAEWAKAFGQERYRKTCERPASASRLGTGEGR